MAVNKVMLGDTTLIDLTSLTVTQDDVREGVTFANAAGTILTGLLQAGGGSSVKVETGTYTISSNMTGNSSTTNSAYYKQVSHSLGVVPDLVIFYAPSNIATTYSMLMAMRWGDNFCWRASNYPSICAYHGNSTTTVNCANVTTSYGICSVTNTYFRVKTYSSSTSYYWRAGTYNWIAVKF